MHCVYGALVSHPSPPNHSPPPGKPEKARMIPLRLLRQRKSDRVLRSSSRLERAVADFNATRPSDIFVINFGAHYPDTAEQEEMFRFDTAGLLDSMAKLGENATVIWRYGMEATERGYGSMCGLLQRSRVLLFVSFFVSPGVRPPQSCWSSSCDHGLH